MHAAALLRLSRKITLFSLFLLLSGCFGQGKGPEVIPGTPAPPPPPLPPGFCDPINFEDACGSPVLVDFAGGSTAIVTNPDPRGVNTSEKSVRMQKFQDQPFGGTTIIPDDPIVFAAPGDFTTTELVNGDAFKVKVWATREVPMTFKLEGLDRERVLPHSGSSSWEELCFDFTGDTDGDPVTGITIIFDNGVIGDAAGDPNNWTFYFDEIEQTENCLGDPLSIDFEDDPASYAIANFGGGVTSVIANPDPSGINESAQVAQMRKFMGEIFGGSTIGVGANVDFSLGEVFKLKVWSQREVPVLFKFEGLDQERSLSHSGSGTWEELCFDFTGSTAGPASSEITFIFDLGQVGNADTDPGNWTFYYDDVEQAASCGDDGGGGDPVVTIPLDFELSPDTYDFGAEAGFGGGATTVIANPDVNALNPSAQVAQMQKFAGEVFGGSTLALDSNVDFAKGEVIKMKVWAVRPVPVLFKFEGLEQERSLNHSGSGMWEELCYDFTGTTNGPASNALTFIFDLGVAGDAGNDPTNWTFYFDDIRQATSCDDDGGGEEMFSTITFDDPNVSYALRGFGGAEDSTLQADPGDASNTVVRVNRADAAETFAGTVVSTGPNESVPPIPLDPMSPRMTIRVNSPAAGLPVRMKIENSGDDGISVETEATTTVANAFETLTFDFSNEAEGTAAFDPNATYDKIVVFMNFGTDGATAGAQTFYFDDIAVAGDDGDGGEGSGTIDFESGMATFLDFEGGVGSVIPNPDMSGINTSGQVAQMEKFAGATFAGTTLDLGGSTPIAPADSYLVSVRSQREVVVTLKLEGVNMETTATHSGSGTWERLCFDFEGVAGDVTGLTFIFDNGVVGDAENDPDNWTFQFDDIEQTSDSCDDGGGGEPGAVKLPVDFELSADSYDFGPEAGFGGGATTVIANPDTNELNPSAQVAQMQKFAGEVFGGSTLALSDNVDFTQGEVFKMKVWATREVPVLFKFEGLDQERTFNHSGSGAWEELCFDFTGSTAGPASSAITFIFDLGVAGNADNDPDNWTFYFDDIEQTDDCGFPQASFPVDFEADPASYDFGPEAGFGGGATTVIANPDQNELNPSAQVAQMQKFAAEVFGGSTLALGGNVDFSAGEAFTMKVWATRQVPVLFKFEGLEQERSVNHSGSGTWEELCFDFTGSTNGPESNAITFIFDLGVVGDADNDPDNWTFFFDDIVQTDSCPTDGGGGAPFQTITFDDPDINYALRGFGGAEDSSLTSDPTDAENTVVQVRRSADAETFAGTVVSTGENESVGVLTLDPQMPQMTLRVASPGAGIPVRMKIENSADDSISVETEATTTVGANWETLTFDFLNEAEGTAAFNPMATYDKVVVFFNFGTDGATAGAQTFFFDDIAVVGDGGDNGGGGDGPDSNGDGIFDFESGVANFTDFEGGVATIVPNPDPSGINTSGQVVRMQKFAGASFGGSTLDPGAIVPIARENSYLVSVRAQRQVVVTLKLEGLNVENTATHSGSGTWEQLCFDFDGSVGEITGFTLIFDNGVVGDAANDPDNWTFEFDDIEQTSESCGNDGGGEGELITLPVDFELPPDSYDFGPDTGFGGGVTILLPNPDVNEANPSAQVAQHRKFGGETFAGSSLTLDEEIDFSLGESIKMKVWSPRAVPVLFKLEGLNQERTRIHNGGGVWEELCFDYTGTTDGPASSAVTFFFDFGALGDADNDPDNWTFYIDDIEQVDDCGIPPAQFPVDFEGDPADFNFGLGEPGFGGGISTVIANPDQNVLNPSAQVAQMQKFGGEVFGGSTLTLDGNVDFSQGEVFKMKVWATRPVPVLFKFEGLNQERAVSHSGSGDWEELCFDFSNTTAGPVSNAITFIFDLGVLGNAENDPDNWTFFFDDIEQTDDCGLPPAEFPIDFEGDPADFNFGEGEPGFGGGITTVIANPDQSGLNTTAQVARMQKFAGENFGGSSLTLTGTVDFTPGEVFTMKVWSQRPVQVLFKFEGLNQERQQVHTGGSEWQELCFDFTGTTVGPITNTITFIFDNGAIGDAGNDPDNWTFFYDEIEQQASCDGGDGGGDSPAPIDFESGMASFSDFEGGVAMVTANPDTGGLNTSAQVGEMQKFAGQPFGGSTLDLGGTVPIADGDSYTMLVRAQREVEVTFKLEPLGVERTATHTGSGTWESLCFDFSGVSGDHTGITLIFDNGVVGDAANDPNAWTFQFDDIAQTSDPCPAPEPEPDAGMFTTITFDDPDTTYTLTDFGGNMSAVTNDPAGGMNMVVMVVKPLGAELWAGTTVSILEGDEIPVLPLDAMNTRMSVRVYSPDAGIPVRLKVEDASSEGAVSVETEALTTVVNEWETLVFDFANEAPGTAAFNPASTYNRLSIFFNFGTDGDTAGERTYYFDDVALADDGDGGGGGGVEGELAVNGGFETGDLTGWTVFENDGSVTVDNSQSNGGDWSVHMVAFVAQNPVIKQEFLAAGAVMPGDTVLVSFDMKGLALAGGVIFPELFSEGQVGATNEILETIVAPTPDWTTYSYMAVAGADVTGGITLQLGVVCGGVAECVADVFIDNVSISIAP
jgi:hypothetical protein